MANITSIIFSFSDLEETYENEHNLEQDELDSLFSNRLITASGELSKETVAKAILKANDSAVVDKQGSSKYVRKVFVGASSVPSVTLTTLYKYKVIEYINRAFEDYDKNWFFEEPVNLLGQTYIANFNHFELGFFVDLLREFPWKEPQDIRLYETNEMSDVSFEQIQVNPIYLTDGYFSRSGSRQASLPAGYVTKLVKFFENVIIENNYTETTFIMHIDVWEALAKKSIFKASTETNTFTVDGFTCKVIIEDNSIGGVLIPTLNIVKSPIFYYKDY